MSREVSIYDRDIDVKFTSVDRRPNVKQLSIDCLPLRKGVRKEFAYHNVNSISTKCKHRHGVDAYDNAKIMSSMASRRRKRCVNLAKQTMYSIVSSDGQVLYTLKSKEIVKKCEALVKRGVKFNVVQV